MHGRFTRFCESREAGMAQAQGDNALARQLHNSAARLQADCGVPSALAAASSHFARGDNSAAFATALATFAQRAPHCERDLFAARAVLQVMIPLKAAHITALCRCTMRLSLSPHTRCHSVATCDPRTQVLAITRSHDMLAYADSRVMLRAQDLGRVLRRAH